MGPSSLESALVPTVASVTAPALFTVTDAAGNQIPPSLLQAFNNGSGLLGSFRVPARGFERARLHVADAAQTPVAAFDPTMLAMIVALIVTRRGSTLSITRRRKCSSTFASVTKPNSEKLFRPSQISRGVITSTGETQSSF